MAKRPGLGRRPALDDRDNQFPLRALLPRAEIKRPHAKRWRLMWHGNQGSTPQCVGYSWYACLRASPVLIKKPMPLTIYLEAQKRDEWPGEEYDGTSVRGAAKYLQEIGVIGEYRWATTVGEIVDWIGTRGPVVLGLNWYRKMFTPDKYGYLIPGGPLDGGHAIAAPAYDDRQGRIEIQNSWPLPWGINGRAYMSYDVLQQLLDENGEACAAVEVKQR